jgi:hypothetical protein
MKILIVSILFLSGFTTHAADSQIINTADKIEIILAPEAAAALKKWDPIFKIYASKDFAPSVIGLFKDSKDSIPMGVVGDFNGDKKQDVAVLGHSGKKEIAVLLLNEGKTYKPIVARTNDYKKPSSVTIPAGELGSEETGLGFYLGVEKAADLNFKKSPNTPSSRDGLQLETYGGDTRLYYLDKKNKLKEYKGLVE